MKKILKNAFGMGVVMAILVFSGCIKDPTKTPPPPTPLPTAPTLSLKADSAWWGGSATVTVTTNAQTVYCNGSIVTGNTVVLSEMKGDRTMNFTAVKTNEYGSASTSESIVVKCHSQRMTLLCNYGPFHFTQTLRCREDSIAYPSAWQDMTKDMAESICNINQFYPNGTGKITIGCGPNVGAVSKGFWSFRQNETIFFDGLNEWTIDLISNSEFNVHSVAPINGSVGLFMRIVLKSSH